MIICHEVLALPFVWKEVFVLLKQLIGDELPDELLKAKLFTTAFQFGATLVS